MKLLLKHTLLALAFSSSVVPLAVAQTKPLTPVKLTTSWYAQAEHGGFYAAKAMGIFEKNGLDVTIVMGGPQVNNPQLLAAGNTDFAMGFHLQTLNAVRAGLPIVTVAAYFQKDPQSLIVHEGSGFDSLPALKGKPIRIPAQGRTSYWPWLKARYQFSDDQLRPYDFTLGPFIADKQAIQQGYITNDGYLLDKGGVKGKSLLLADYGWDAYAGTVETTRQMIEKRPEVVAALVRSVSEGWAAYFANPGPANALIKKDNPQMEDAMLAYTHAALQRLGILATAPGSSYGVMTDARWESFFQNNVAAGNLPADLNYKQAYTLQFVKALP